jgi:hypothetical protein
MSHGGILSAGGTSNLRKPHAKGYGIEAAFVSTRIRLQGALAG